MSLGKQYIMSTTHNITLSFRITSFIGVLHFVVCKKICAQYATYNYNGNILLFCVQRKHVESKQHPPTLC